MRRELIETIERTVVLLTTVFCLALQVRAQKADTPYPNMAPVDQYLMTDRNTEIALARSAAPRAISDGAEVMMLDRQGYKTVVKGTNGFVCIVERSWAAGLDDPDFWNPKQRSPICFNPPAARSYLPIILAKTTLALAGKSKAQVFDAIEAALDKKELPALETGAMGYMMSRDGYLSDRVGHWHPHLMIFVPLTDAKVWGAGLPGSPIFGSVEIPGRMSLFLVPIPTWSDGTADSGK